MFILIINAFQPLQWMKLGAILRPERQKQEQDFQDSMKDHQRLEKCDIKSVTDPYQTIHLQGDSIEIHHRNHR